MGLLIVNADDLGFDRVATDAILTCFEAGRISSASAMVWMSDSERAAALARDSGLPTRLHLNLTEPFTSASVPPEVRQRQADLARYFASARFAYWFCNPRLQAKIEAAIEDQMRGFELLYGKRPVELDGHQHVQSCANVLLSRSLGQVEAVRSTFTFSPAEKGWANWTIRSIANWVLRRRFKSTQWSGSLRALDHSLDSDRLAEWVARSRTSTVELITHPANADELAFLMSSSWIDALAPASLGSLMDLSH